MSISPSQHVGCLLLYSCFHIEGVLGRGGEGGIGHATYGSTGLGLRPALVAVFALTITIAILTAYQLQRSLWRFKRLKLPEGEPALSYDVGMLFRALLVSYTAMYLIYGILYAVYIASLGDTLVLPSAFNFGVWVTAQASKVLFYATLLSIIAYRQRIQLNSKENLFNLKSFLDGLLLVAILGLGAAEDGILGNLKSTRELITLANISLVHQIILLLASIDVAVSSLIARARLSKAGIQDKIINISAFAVSPIVFTGEIYGVIDAVIQRHPSGALFKNFDALFVVSIAIEGVVSIAVISCCLLMGAPPKSVKATGNGGFTGMKV